MNTPTPDDAAAIYRTTFGRGAARADRFPTGTHHHVFDVDGPAGAAVVRIASTRGSGTFDAAARWSALLRPLGVRLPAIRARGTHDGFDFLVLERLPGTDLCHVYRDLTPAQRREIAANVARAQRCLDALPDGPGFGHAAAYDDPSLRPTWRAVIEANLARSRARISASRVVDVTVVDRVWARLDALDPILRAVRPRPFLDDATTKNVLCDGGRFVGIVDVDEVCFGDPLFAPALTRASLIAGGLQTDYVDFWLAERSPDAAGRAAFALYVGVFCLDLLSEAGQRFNRCAPPPIDAARIGRLTTSVARWLADEGPADQTDRV